MKKYIVKINISHTHVRYVLQSLEQITKTLHPYEKILSKKEWKTPQIQWLQAIAKQMKATTIVDDVALDNGIFKQQLGGVKRANKLFEQPITQVLSDFNRALWAS